MSTLLQTVPVTKRAGAQIGARIAIDPKDGNPFVSIGDRSTGDPIPLQAQQRDTYLGKIVHITPDGKPAPTIHPWACRRCGRWATGRHRG